jgi:type IV secretory pathway VirB2 component (pilin)
MKTTYIKSLLFLVLTMLFASSAHASVVGNIVESGGQTQEQIAFATYICKIRTCFLTNRLILTVATIALSILAIMIMFGKVNWTAALVTIVGIVIVTSAYAILDSSGIIPNAVPSFGFTWDNNHGTPIRLTTEDPCAAIGCFNAIAIGRNIGN